MRHVATFLLFLFCAVAGAAEQRICIGTLDIPTGDASGGRNWPSSTTFSVSFDDNTIVVAKGESDTLVVPDIETTTAVVIKKDGEPYSAFQFDPSVNKAAEYCLWLYWPHATWQLYEYESGKWGCSCFG